MSYTVYIDESGDLGNRSGTQWFILTAVIIDDKDEKNIRNSLNVIKSDLNLKTIHWRLIRNFYDKAYIVNKIACLPFTYSCVIFDTMKYDTSKFISYDSTYNHMCRYLLERVSWFIRDNNQTAKIILSGRGTSKDAELVNYIKNKLIPYPDNRIYNVFTDITYKKFSLWDMLQFVDVCSGSIYNAHETNSHGFVTKCHANILKNHLYSHNGKIYKYGIKYYSDDMKPNSQYFEKRSICKQ